MAKRNRERIEEVGALILIPGMFALLLTAGYHLVSVFVQLMANEYAAHVWNSRF